ncbi:helix-turn-helix transcriptional regulator [Saccharothrix deserti]|uniref:helix-turn-helix transcriptional regulator n=1 Tax=Saccharothrix deserti TaxID=2593674 RepID=UPI00131D818E|nr:response regulator transcription factor [Saccharothrix deserti]
MHTIRVTLSLESPVLRDKINDLLGNTGWAEVCSPRDLTAGVTVLDARAAVRVVPRSATVAVLDSPDGSLLESLVHAGVSGLVLADDPVEDFARAVRDVHRFGGWISPRLTGLVFGMLPVLRPAGPALTAREREALRLLADGRENAEIAAAMFITVSAVKYHVSNLLRKFDCKDRTQLVAQVWCR